MWSETQIVKFLSRMQGRVLALSDSAADGAMEQVHFLHHYQDALSALKVRAGSCRLIYWR